MNIAIQRKQNISIIMGLILVLLFAAALNLISRYYFFIFIAFFLFMMKPKRKYRIDAAVGWLVVLALSWVLFAPSAAVSTLSMLKPFAYVLCYIMGAGFFDDGIENNKEKSPYRLFYIITVTLALGTFVHYILNWATNMDTVERNTVDIWTQEVMGATGQAALACLPLGLAISFLFSKTGKLVKILSATTIVLILIYNLVLSGRTLLVMLLAIVAVSFLHRLSMQKGGRIRVIVIFLVIVLLILFVYQTDLFGVRSMVEDSPLYKRFFSKDKTSELDEDVRMEKKIYFLNNMHRFLFGGAHIREEMGYSHDIIFDTHDEAGIFAFIAMLGYLTISAAHLIRCVTDKSLPFVFRNAVLCIYGALYLEFMVEPILLGMPWLFATFCLIDGYVGRVLNHNRMIKSGVR